MSCERSVNWRDMPDGSRTCDYCGSLHPEDMIDIMYRYAQREEGFHFGTTTKGYKLYANRPKVGNAMQGGIKFYTNHITDEWKDQFEAAFQLVAPVYRARLEEQWGPGTGGLR